MNHKSQLSAAKDIETYFTNVEDLREAFRRITTDTTASKRVLMIHGVGGVGKSSLLKMFRLYCRDSGLPSAFASGDEQRSLVDVLTRWNEDLVASGLRMSAFSAKLKRYQIVLSRIETQIQIDRKKSEKSGKGSGLVGKFAVKTAEGGAGLVAGAALGAINPVLGMLAGPVFSAVIGTSGEALMEWLSKFLEKSDIDLLLNPSEMTQDLLSDLARNAVKRRLVLMLDTFEQLSTLDEWLCNFAQRLHPNAILVIASRTVPDWGRHWQSWLVNTHLHELTPLSNNTMHELALRYYGLIHGGTPDEKQLASIIQFARGLPIVITSAIGLWVQYGVENFQSVKPQVMADLVDRLLEGVPSPLVRVIEAASAVRWFNKDILRAVLREDNIDQYYDALRHFPFTRPRVEGLSLHDTVREIIDENLRVHDIKKHILLHQSALSYFESCAVDSSRNEVEKASLEQLYHSFRLDEKKGVQLFRKIAEEFVRYRLIDRLKTLLNDVNTYPTNFEASNLWRAYYGVRLQSLSVSQEDSRADSIEQSYRDIISNTHSDATLRAYALCDLGRLLKRAESRSVEDAIRTLELVPKTIRELDSKTATYLSELVSAYRRQGRWDDAYVALQKAQSFYESIEDNYGLAITYNRMKYQYLDQGLWAEAVAVQSKALTIATKQTENSYLKAEIIGGSAISWAWAGAYSKAERELFEAIDLAQRIDDLNQQVNFFRDLGLVQAIQGRHEFSTDYFQKSLDIGEAIGASAGNALTKGFQGYALTKRLVSAAKELINESIDYHYAFSFNWHIPMLLNWRGVLEEINGEYDMARSDYQNSLAICDSERNYLVVNALLGLFRSMESKRNLVGNVNLLEMSWKTAQKHSYNDVLAHLCLFRGNAIWEMKTGAQKTDIDNILQCYQNALVYALNYNCILLDEILFGGGYRTVSRSIIQNCLSKGQRGMYVLEVLRNWWNTDAYHSVNLSQRFLYPVSQDAKLLSIEDVFRRQDSTGALQQNTVIKRIDDALSGVIG